MLKSISAKEQYGRTPKVDATKKIELDLNEAPPWMFAKKYVSIKVCTVCGEVDKTITANFDKEIEEMEDDTSSEE